MGTFNFMAKTMIVLGFLFTLVMASGLPQASADPVLHQTIVVRKGMSLPVPVGTVYDRIAVSEPEIADAAPVSDQEYFVRGRFPDAAIDLYPVADRVHVRGSVEDQLTIDQIMEVVESHAPGLSINALSTELPAQVLLEVRFIEASRDDIKEIGFGTEVSRPGDFLFMTSSNLLSGGAAQTVGTLLGQSGNTSIDTFLQALEEKGVVRTLAKPNLVSQSGQPASFLAGGEFPVPVAADEGTVTIEFKKFGVSLEFTPTVATEDRIVLQVSPEVSGLDPRNSVRLADVEIPALSVRKINTQVELGNGQSFAIAGLIQNDFQASKAQTPLLGDVPILGNLFRSSRFKKNETELVVIITPYLIKPADSPEALSSPLAGTEEPDFADRYVYGRVEGEPTAVLGDAVESNIRRQAERTEAGS